MSRVTDEPSRPGLAPEPAGSEYRRVLATWAREMLPVDVDPVKVTDVRLDFDRGFGGSDVTPPDDPSLSVAVRYLLADGQEGSYVIYDDGQRVQLTMTRLLTELFRLADLS